MNNDLRKQIHNTLNLKDTNELLDIWQINNRAEWSDDAFDVIKDILMERGEEIFEQDDPIYEIEEGDEEALDEKLENWEIIALDAEEQPEFYSVADVLLLKKNINRVAKAAVIIYALIAILNIPWVSMLLRNGTVKFSDIFQFGYETIAVIISVAIQIAVIYFPLKALTHILRILMEMEFNSRKTD